MAVSPIFQMKKVIPFPILVVLATITAEKKSNTIVMTRPSDDFDDSFVLNDIHAESFF